MGVYFSPGETFKDIGRTPKILVPLIILAVVVGSTFTLAVHQAGLENIMHKQMDPLVEKGWMPQEQADKAIQQAKANPTVAYVRTGLTQGITAIIVALIVAGIFKLISMVIGTENSFKQILSVTLFTSLALWLVYAVIAVFLLYLQNPEDIDANSPVSSNLGAILGLITDKKSLPGFVKGFAAFIDVFSIWKIALLSIGYAVVSTKAKISTVAIWLSVLYLLAALVFSPLIGMFM